MPNGSIPWTTIFTNKEVLALTLSYFAFVYVAWIFFAWFYIYMAQVRGLNLKASAAFSMLPFIAMTIGCLGGGAVSDWIAVRFGLRTGRCLLPALSLALTAILLVTGSRAHSAASAGVTLACGAGVLYISQSGFWAVSADIAGENVGVVSAIMNMGGQLGGACSASLTPMIAAHFGWEMSFVIAASIAALGADGMADHRSHEALRRSRHKPDDGAFMNSVIWSAHGAESARVAGHTIPFTRDAGSLLPDLRYAELERLRREQIDSSDPLC